MIDIKSRFSKSAWAYAVFYDKVQVGVWDGEKLAFHDRAFEESDVVELRVFNSDSELRLTRLPDGKLAQRFIDDTGKTLTDADVSDLHYSVYGKKEKVTNGWTLMSEDKGGTLWIPASIEADHFWLKVRNYFQWKSVPVGKRGADDSDLKPGKDSGPGGLEFTDYRFAGFYYDNSGKGEVKINA
ncbi:MAG: hypothetical protein LBT59_08395 [Clostridiales bacterium]|jgi:CRISPR-associated protein (TIGR03984 family)|nr:hypothetical protein [Clostridiales bacterium]